MTFSPSILLPGDLMVYSGYDLFDLAIEFRTAYWASHVEVYIGQYRTAASRNGEGVKRYAFRKDGLKYVLRPKVPFNHQLAMRWFYGHAMGLPYGWWELLNCIVPWRINADGMFCSQFATEFYRHGGFEPFNNRWDSAKVTPRDFVESSAFVQVWP